MTRSEPALLRLLRGDPALRREFEDAICDFLHKYNRDQPRVPAGNREGGQWTSTGIGQPTSTDPGRGLFGLPLDTSSLLMRPSYSSPASAPLHMLVHEALLDQRDDFPFNEHRNDSTIRPLDPMGDGDPSAHRSESLLPLSASNFIIGFLLQMARPAKRSSNSSRAHLAGSQRMIPSIWKAFKDSIATK